MPSWTLNRLSLVDGNYRGVLTGQGKDAPALEILLDGQSSLGNLSVTPRKGSSGTWEAVGEIGAAVLTEGTHTITIRTGDTVLDTLTIVAGLEAPDDLRAEVDALRAELSLLKAAFRRHVNETT